jgi:type II secretory pathway component PulF
VDRFTRRLATLVRTNVPLLRAMSLIEEQAGSSPNLGKVVTDLREQVKQGRQLSEAMAKFPKVFDQLYVSMVFAGERGGVLDETLAKLAEHREKELETRRRIQAAMAYPSFVVAVGILTVFVVVTFILPKVMPLFETLDSDLPWSTNVLIWTVGFMRGYWPWIVIAVALFALVLGRGDTGSRRRQVADLFKLHMPVVKTLVKNAEIAKFARTLALMVRSGISVQEGLQLATATVGNAVFRDKVGAVGKDIVNRGATLSTSLARSGLFPSFAVNMVGVGEESGELADALQEVAAVYDQEVEQSVKLLVSMLEPALIILVGGVVAFIVFAMLMPIFDLGAF